jgi:hypothetical protein
VTDQKWQSGPKIRFAVLRERQSQQSGATYYLGFSGTTKILLLKDKEAAPDGSSQWNLLFEEQPPKDKSIDTHKGSNSRQRTAGSNGQWAMSFHSQAPEGGQQLKFERARRSPSRRHATLSPGELDDSVHF